MMMLEANREDEHHWAPQDLFAIGGRAYAKAIPIVTAEEPFFKEDVSQDIDLGKFDVIWMRKDLHLIWIIFSALTCLI